MALFGRRRGVPAQTPTVSSGSGAFASASSLPEPSTDWRDPASVRAEWSNQLEGEEQGLLGWRNGMRMFEEGVIPGQTLNVAECMTRGLAYHLFTPVLSDPDALVASKRVLTLVDRIPAEPAFFAEFGPRLSRLALTIIRENGWQPSSLGGDDSVTTEILNARPDGLVLHSARCPGVPLDEVWSHFFCASQASG